MISYVEYKNVDPIEVWLSEAGESRREGGMGERLINVN
jgi:hypothetical protein